ncbi:MULTISPECIES: RBBP9/YdeN family alpha/beta hydrolase [unclassified Campylobacter]|uniref:RBBP9/YdeN family alpha/beta hydrolase n=1 Tax=unclassified Campylobacter TaxID=2593542 RepID=UPI001237DE76|nr:MULTISPECIES: alpha/beta fold hydrolase [unclassified Campylobacter]KAA6226461.1 serine hydrolase family protein [Campylobacter sp. LR185c]KAA6228597.1 serine hydrolase family protein [Campylobacter sp. LR196d]KAA6229150.1 serine hydrolase family protein [Campylobacter sp. LR286c]KAA6233941.1 serine hydrolase family protein [Campylobacter sp. LR291e]KAA6234179.1 serine hydrolase family protein [Campylobacter sp. LR264d]
MQVYIIHGFESNPKRNWFPWLQENLILNNINAFTPTLPNSSTPNVDEWLETLSKECKNIDENTYFVAHSLGCLITLLFLQKINKKIGGIILVSGFSKLVNHLPLLENFTKTSLDYENLIKLSPKRLIIAARDDYIIPLNLTHNLAKNLRASYVEFEKGGHFMQEDGFTKMPLILNTLLYFNKF